MWIQIGENKKGKKSKFTRFQILYGTVKGLVNITFLHSFHTKKLHYCLSDAIAFPLALRYRMRCVCMYGRIRAVLFMNTCNTNSEFVTY